MYSHARAHTLPGHGAANRLTSAGWHECNWAEEETHMRQDRSFFYPRR
jgi:hypothetical protein